MEPIDYLRIFRRRWAAILVICVLGGVIAVLTTPSKGASGPLSYQGTATLLLSPNAPAGTPSLPQAALLLTTGTVPSKVAGEINYKGDPAVLASRVTGKPDTSVDDLQITATSVNGPNAAQLANAFAEQLIASLNATATANYQQQVNSVQSRLNQLSGQIDSLNQKIGSQTTNQDPVDSAQRTALINQYSLAYDQFQQIAAQGAPQPAFTILQHAVPVAVSDRSFRAPTGRKARLAIGLVAGLILAAGLMLVLDRIDPRIRTREEAEKAYGYPVIAEIPSLPRRHRHTKELETILRPGSPFAESHRILRTLLLLSRPVTAPSDDGAVAGQPADPRVILVISAGPAEGKTTTVAHLAVAFAEAGRSVLVLSCDFHRPRIHEMFDLPEGRGLTDVLSTSGLELADVVQATSVRGVSLVASGSYVANPAELIGSDHRVLDEARELADIVLIDTAPVLVANDASELMPEADAVVVVARAGKATTAAAERASDLLNRVGAKVVGVVLTAAPEAPTNERNYYYRSYFEHGATRGWRRWFGGRPPAGPEVAPPNRVEPRGARRATEPAASGAEVEQEAAGAAKPAAATSRTAPSTPPSEPRACRRSPLRRLHQGGPTRLRTRAVPPPRRLRTRRSRPWSSARPTNGCWVSWGRSRERAHDRLGGCHPAGAGGRLAAGPRWVHAARTRARGSPAALGHRGGPVGAPGSGVHLRGAGRGAGGTVRHRTEQDLERCRGRRPHARVGGHRQAGGVISTVSPLLPALAVSDLLESALPMAIAPLTDDAWADLLSIVRSDRLEGVLTEAVLGGTLPVTDAQWREACDAANAAAGLAVRLERRLLEATTLLEEQGIVYRVLKGAAVAHTIYPDPVLRGFGDVDLLIGSHDWDAAVSVMAEHGYSRTLGEVRAGFDHRFGKEATMVGRDRVEVDLHRTLVIGPFGLTIDLPSLFDAPGSVTIGGRELPILDPDATFLHACYSVAIADDPPHLRSLRDVARIVLSRPPDVDRVLERARSWRAEAVVARALRVTWEMLPLPDGGPLLAWARAHRPRRLDGWMVSSYLGPGRSYRSQAAALLVIPGVRDRWAYLRALAFPQRDYLAHRSGSRKSHWRRSLEHLRRSRAA